MPFLSSSRREYSFILILLILSFLSGYIFHDYQHVTESFMDYAKADDEHQQQQQQQQQEAVVAVHNENNNNTILSSGQVLQNVGMIDDGSSLNENVTTTTPTTNSTAAEPNINNNNNNTNSTTKSSSSSSSFVINHPPYHGSLAKVYHYYSSSSNKLPCFPQTTYKPNPKNNPYEVFNPYSYAHYNKKKKGMFYTKISKCSSSTLAGVAIQIARNYANRLRVALASQNSTTIIVPPPNNGECYVNADHGSYRDLMERTNHQKRSDSMVWTFLREPAKRQMSDFYHFHVSRRNVDPTNNDTIVKNYALDGLKMSWYMTGGIFRTTNYKELYHTPEKQVAYIMDKYDFIGLVDRYHESLILLKLVFDLNLRDILYTSAKRSGGYDDGEYRRTCFLIQKSYVSPHMKEWFQYSEEWKEYAKTDILLYRVINKSLDLTIDAFGKDHVTKEIEIYEKALLYADEICGPTAIYPCSPEGKYIQPNETTCIAHDWACAHKCLETLDLSQFEEEAG